jgi:hypothetical protein
MKCRMLATPGLPRDSLESLGNEDLVLSLSRVMVETSVGPLASRSPELAAVRSRMQFNGPKDTHE